MYRIIVFPVVLYGCETWSLTLREVRRLRVFWNRVLRRVFRPMRYEVTGDWRKLYNGNLVICNPYRIFCGWYYREEWDGWGLWQYGEGRGVHRFLVGKSEGKRPLGDPDEDNIKMDFQELGGGCGDWMDLDQDRDRWLALESTVMTLGIPKMRGIYWLAAEPVSFSRRTLVYGVNK